MDRFIENCQKYKVQYMSKFVKLYILVVNLSKDENNVLLIYKTTAFHKN